MKLILFTEDCLLVSGLRNDLIIRKTFLILWVEVHQPFGEC